MTNCREHSTLGVGVGAFRLWCAWFPEARDVGYQICGESVYFPGM